jgi:hypothetical protein
MSVVADTTNIGATANRSAAPRGKGVNRRANLVGREHRHEGEDEERRVKAHLPLTQDGDEGGEDVAQSRRVGCDTPHRLGGVVPVEIEAVGIEGALENPSGDRQEDGIVDVKGLAEEGEEQADRERRQPDAMDEPSGRRTAARLGARAASRRKPFRRRHAAPIPG